MDEPLTFTIHQRGVQWKQGVVVYIVLSAVLLYNTTPIHCTPLRLHPPLMNTQTCMFLKALGRSYLPSLLGPSLDAMGAGSSANIWL